MLNICFGTESMRHLWRSCPQTGFQRFPAGAGARVRSFGCNHTQGSRLQSTSVPRFQNSKVSEVARLLAVSHSCPHCILCKILGLGGVPSTGSPSLKLWTPFTSSMPKPLRILETWFLFCYEFFPCCSGQPFRRIGLWRCDGFLCLTSWQPLQRYSPCLLVTIGSKVSEVYPAVGLSKSAN